MTSGEWDAKGSTPPFSRVLATALPRRAAVDGICSVDDQEDEKLGGGYYTSNPAYSFAYIHIQHLVRNGLFLFVLITDDRSYLEDSSDTASASRRSKAKKLGAPPCAR